MLLARTLADQVGSGRVDDQVVLDFLTQYGRDEPVMSVFFSSLGGAGTLGLVNRGPGAVGDVRAQDLEWVAAVRAGFATGSAGWTDRQAGAFADGLFAGMDPEAAYGASGWQIVSLALLFEGPPFAGERVTVAVADRLDELDRREHLVAVPDSAGPRGLLDALRAEVGLRVFGEGGYVSPADAVFRTLGQYPQASSDWLVADPYGDRVEHWFKEYPWAEHGMFEGRGGFEGVLTLLSATQGQEVRGLGEVDGVVVRDLEAMERAARLASQGLTALTQNPAWAEDGLIDREGERLADVINENWTAIHAIWTREGKLSLDRTVRTAAAKFVPAEDVVPLANIDPSVVTLLVGAAAFSDAGEARLRQGYGDFVAANVIAASCSSVSPPQQVQELQKLMALALDRIEGSQDWARVDSAMRAAASVSSTVATTLLIAGIAASGIPTGGAAWGAYAVGAAVSLGSQGVQTGVDALGQRRVAEVKLSIEDLTDDRYRAELTDDVRVAATLLGVELPPHPSTYTHPFSVTDPPDRVGPPRLTEEMWLERCVELVNYEFAIQDGSDPSESGFDVADKARNNRTDREASPR